MILFQKNQAINSACKPQSSKPPAEQPYPVNETLQEPLGRVNPRSHLLLVLGEDSKEERGISPGWLLEVQATLGAFGEVGWLVY